MKRALITGASGDIGAAIGRKLAEQGLHVILHAHRSTDKAEQLRDELRSTGASAESVCFDVTDPEQTQAALERLLGDGAIQIVVNNAGSVADAPMAGMSRPQWQQTIDVSLHGFFNVTQPLLLPMIRTRWGRILNITSIAGIHGNRGQANYAAAKAGLHGATKSLALELASRGITVNAIAPGIIAGKLTDTYFSEDRIKSMVPMQRAGRPEEVAALAGFLASDEACYISGQIISINGAMG